MVALVAVARTDIPAAVPQLAHKLVNLRLFASDAGPFDRSLLETGQHLLLVSQFTLYADTTRGRRPGFSLSAPAEQAEPMFDALVDACRKFGIPTQTGKFGATMQVELINDGPATLLIDV